VRIYWHCYDFTCVSPGDLATLGNGEQRAALETAHPRLPHLAKKYGMMAGLTPSSGAAIAGSSGPGGGTALGSTMLRLRLTFSASDGGAKTRCQMLCLSHAANQGLNSLHTCLMYAQSIKAVVHVEA